MTQAAILTGDKGPGPRVVGSSFSEKESLSSRIGLKAILEGMGSFYSKLDLRLHKAYLYVVGDLVSSVTNGFSLWQLSTGGSDSRGLQGALGLTSAFGFITNACGAVITAQGYIRAKKIGDIWGVCHELAMAARYTAAMTATIVMMPVRVMTIMLATSSAKKVNMVALQRLGLAATGLYIGVYSCLGVPYLIRGLKSIMDYKGLCDKQTPKERLAYLMEMISINDQDKEEIRKGMQNEKADATPLNDAEKKLLSSDDKAFLHPLKGYDKAARLLIRIKERKKDVFSRTFGSSVYETLIEKGAELITRVESGDDKAIKEAGEIISKAKVTAKKLIGIYIFVAFVCFLGVAAFILSIAASGGATLLAAFLIMQITNGLMLMIDGYEVYDTLKTKPASKQDQALMIFSLVFLVGCTVLGAVLTATGAPFLVTIIAGSIIAFIEALIVYHSGKEKKQDSKTSRAVGAGSAGAGLGGMR